MKNEVLLNILLLEYYGKSSGRPCNAKHKLSQSHLNIPEVGKDNKTTYKIKFLYTMSFWDVRFVPAAEVNLQSNETSISARSMTQYF
jgi:hypothetical protein